ncbi:hypothetical protein [Mycolicibacter minnesotensis]
MEPETAATPTSDVVPSELAWGDEPDPGDAPAGTSWRLVAALAGSIAVSAVLLIGGAWSWTHRSTEPPRAGTTTATAPAPPVATPPPSPGTTTVVAAPPVTVTVTQPPPSTTVQSAGPQVPAVAQEICDMLRRYPGMYRVDVALTLSMDRRVYRDYDTARPVVDNAVANYCPDQAR